MSDFTPTQGRYLSYIQAYTKLFGYPPAESEIASGIGVAPPSAHQMLKTLEKKALIRRKPGVARSIEILVDQDAIPQWKGPRVTGSPHVWTVPRRRPTRAIGGGVGRIGMADVYRFKITLLETDPPIWRRIETLDVTLDVLHQAIQTSMGWTNSHLHQFEIGGRCYGDPGMLTHDDSLIDYCEVRISYLLVKYGSRLRMQYEYDFGDSWRHKVSLEKMTKAEPAVRYPRCIAGERACPPEDVGGSYGFADLLAAIADPDDEDEELLEWADSFDPEKFDAAEATRRMASGLPAW